jgi:hypothetical protein
MKPGNSLLLTLFWLNTVVVTSSDRGGTMAGLLTSAVWAGEGEFFFGFVVIRFRSLLPAVDLKKSIVMA